LYGLSQGDLVLITGIGAAGMGRILDEAGGLAERRPLRHSWLPELARTERTNVVPVRSKSNILGRAFNNVAGPDIRMLAGTGNVSQTLKASMKKCWSRLQRTFSAELR
jgi:hypothetical protein